MIPRFFCSLMFSGRFVKKQNLTRYQRKLTSSNFSEFYRSLFSEMSCRLEQLSVGVGGGQGFVTKDRDCVSHNFSCHSLHEDHSKSLVPIFRD